MKNVFLALKALYAALISALLLAGCSSFISDMNDSEEYGSLSVSTSSTSNSSGIAGRAIYVDEIKSIKVTVTGFSSSGKKFEQTATSTDSNSATVTGIPLSKNVAVMVQAYSDCDTKSAISGIVLYAKTDIISGTNKIEVSKSTSNLGSVFAQLIASDVNTNKISDTSSITAAIPSDVNYSLIDAAAIVTDYKASSLKASSNYVKAAATVNVTPDNVSGYTVQISDPNSSVNTMGTAETAYSVAPGSWTIYAIDSNGTVKASKGITVTAGSTASVTVKKTTESAVTDKIVVYVPKTLGYTYCYAWDSSQNKLLGDWAGTAMTEDGDNYVATISAASCGLIFSKNSSGANQTSDFSISAAGAYTFDGSSFTKKEISSGETVTITVNGSQGGGGEDLTNCIKVHAKYSYVYVWNSGTAVDTKHNAMTSDGEGSSWYSYVINATKSSLIFENDANWSGKTSDLSIDKAGEYWYSSGSFYSYNPEDTTAPVLVSFTSDKTGTVSGDVTFTVSATDNLNLSKAVLTTSTGITIGTISLSGTSATGSYTWSTAEIQNASYTINCTLYDAGGNKVTGNAITLTTSNVNLPPVAVISGSKKPACDKSVTYKATSSYDQNGGTIKSYTWTLTGSGATISSGASSDTLVVKTSAKEGATFTLSLTVTDNDGAASSAVTLDCTTVAVDADWDFRNESIYFLMTARWYDGDSTNNRYCRADDKSGNRANNDPPWRGDFKGIIEKLDYIKAMGFSAIWITPPVLNRSDYDYHGYHAWDMTKIDPRLESDDATYQDLIDACHAKGIKIIQDIVLNHTSRYGMDNFFVPKYWGDRDNADWGTSSDINYYDVYNPEFHYDGISVEPNSGKSWYNGDLWQKEKPTLSWNPDLSDWGVEKGTNSDNRKWYGCQWPTLTLFDPELFHTKWLGNWEGPDCQTGTIHEDCIDLNTESAKVQKYLIDAYSKYIEMGVDAFRIDTVKHINRVIFNRRFNPAFMEAAANAGNDKFFMFGEVCTKVNDLWNHDNPSLSAPFYTWKETQEWSDDDATAASECYEANCTGGSSQPTTNNAFLEGNSYHTPDYTNKSDLSVIDFPMHMNFTDAGNAYGQRGGDKYYNDATWNVVYVESHDYSPDNGPANDHDARCTAGDDEWAEDMALMWTFRGIPCLFQGSEIRFHSGDKIDAGSTMPLDSTGRAYYGTNIEGTIEATDFGEWNKSTLSGNVKTTMEYPLVPHVARLNKIRRAIPALQKGQYSNENCNTNGAMAAFKRRYTNTTTGIDSFVLVSLSGGATFTNLPAGTYVDVITGSSQTISEGGTVTATCSGQGNARIYVLQNSTATEYGATGKIGSDTNWLK